MYTITPMTRPLAQQISHWKYEGEYALYSFTPDEETMAELMDGSYFACQQDGALIGYFCFGASARIPLQPHEATAYEPDLLDFGLGMDPALCGQGRGSSFMQAGLAFAQEKFQTSNFRLAVAAFNQRAIHLYQKMGFVRCCQVHHRFSGQMFEIMTMQPKDAD